MTKNEIASAIVSQIENMYENDIINGYGTESFECWCEDGQLFKDMYPYASEDDVNSMIECMRTFAPYVDQLTNEIEKFIS